MGSGGEELTLVAFLLFCCPSQDSLRSFMKQGLPKMTPSETPVHQLAMELPPYKLTGGDTASVSHAGAESVLVSLVDWGRFFLSWFSILTFYSSCQVISAEALEDPVLPPSARG